MIYDHVERAIKLSGEGGRAGPPSEDVDLARPFFLSDRAAVLEELRNGSLNERAQRLVVRLLRTEEPPDLDALNAVLRGGPEAVRWEVVRDGGVPGLNLELVARQLDSRNTLLACDAAEVLSGSPEGAALIRQWVCRLITSEQVAFAHEARVLQSCLRIGRRLEEGPALVHWLLRYAKAQGEEDRKAWAATIEAMPQGWFEELAPAPEVTDFRLPETAPEGGMRPAEIRLRQLEESANRLAGVPEEHAETIFRSMVAAEGGAVFPVLEILAQRRTLAPKVLAAAAAELARSSDASYLPTLIRLFHHPSLEVQQAAVRGVAGYGEQLSAAATLIAGDDLAEDHVDTFTKVMAGEPIPDSWSLTEPWTTEPEDDDEMLRMSFGEHLKELGLRLAGICALALPGAALGWWYREPVSQWVFEWLYAVPVAQLHLPPLQIWRVVVPVALAAWMSAPVVLWQAWAFVAPGLFRGERRLALRLFQSVGIAAAASPLAIALVARLVHWSGAIEANTIVRWTNGLALALIWIGICVAGAGRAWVSVSKAIVRNRHLRLLAGRKGDVESGAEAVPRVLLGVAVAILVFLAVTPASWIVLLAVGAVNAVAYVVLFLTGMSIWLDHAPRRPAWRRDLLVGLSRFRLHLLVRSIHAGTWLAAGCGAMLLTKHLFAKPVDRWEWDLFLLTWGAALLVALGEVAGTARALIAKPNDRRFTGSTLGELLRLLGLAGLGWLVRLGWLSGASAAAAAVMVSALLFLAVAGARPVAGPILMAGAGLWAGLMPEVVLGSSVWFMGLTWTLLLSGILPLGGRRRRLLEKEWSALVSESTAAWDREMADL